MDSTKTVAYVRVSTSHQDIKSQKDKVEVFAKERGFSIVDFFIDDGISGAEEDRPELIRLGEWVKENPNSRVIMTSLDRQARDFYIYAKYQRLFEENQVEDIYISSPQTGDVAVDSLMKNILASFAAYEKTAIMERFNRGKRYLLKNGVFASGGQAPFGYKFTGIGKTKRMEVNPQEAEDLKFMFKTYLEKPSVRHLQRVLKKNKMHSRAGNIWSMSSIHHILRNETYIGTWKYGKTKSVGKGSRTKEIPRDSDSPDIIKIKVTPLIDKKTFKLTQHRLKQRTTQYPFGRSPNKNKYLLKGLVRCGLCHYRFSGEGGTPSKRWWYYRCNSSVHTVATSGKRGCGNKSIKGHLVEPVIWKMLCNILLDPSRFKKLYSKNKATRKKELADLQDLIASNNQKLDNIKSKKNRILDLYAEGDYSKKELEEYMFKLDEEKKTMGDKQKQLVKRALTLANLNDLIFDIKDRLSKKVLLNASDNLKKELVQRYIKEIVAYPDRLEIFLTIPTKPKRLILTTSKASPILVPCNNATFLLNLRLNASREVDSFEFFKYLPEYVPQTNILTA